MVQTLIRMTSKVFRMMVKLVTSVATSNGHYTASHTVGLLFSDNLQVLKVGARDCGGCGGACRCDIHRQLDVIRVRCWIMKVLQRLGVGLRLHYAAKGLQRLHSHHPGGDLSRLRGWKSFAGQGGGPGTEGYSQAMTQEFYKQSNPCGLRGVKE